MAVTLAVVQLTISAMLFCLVFADAEHHPFTSTLSRASGLVAMALAVTVVI